MTTRIHAGGGLTPRAARRERRHIAQGCFDRALEASLAGTGTRNLPALVCDAKTRAGTPCKAVCTTGETRCRLHGGHSTGPKTAEGKARCAESRWGKKRETHGTE